jgi:hypothetical protein
MGQKEVWKMIDGDYLNIQGQVEDLNKKAQQMAADGELDQRGLQLVLETNQQYIDYLDMLLESDLTIESGVVVGLKGQKVKFTNDSFLDWLSERIYDDYKRNNE